MIIKSHKTLHIAAFRHDKHKKPKNHLIWLQYKMTRKNMLFQLVTNEICKDNYDTKKYDDGKPKFQYYFLSKS